MKKLNLDFTEVFTPEQAHVMIAAELDFPSFYGRNLDALYDCLTDITEDLELNLLPPSEKAALSGWFQKAVRVFTDAAGENSHLTIAVQAHAKPKIAVLFPGIGYTCDRSLLYFSGKLAETAGYEIRTVPYGDFPKGVKGNRSKMEASFYSAMEQTEKLLADMNWENYGDILFVSKSIGTIVASAYAKQHGLQVRSVLFTPLKDTFQFLDKGAEAAAFHGTSDPWAETDEIVSGCKEKGIALHLTEHANHSLETGDVMTDLKTLTAAMQTVKEMLK
ncbi:MAG: barstar family protein [Eubacterium sp.]|nr:barstar family protein [Eubacterium sp.]